MGQGHICTMRWMQLLLVEGEDEVGEEGWETDLWDQEEENEARVVHIMKILLTTLLDLSVISPLRWKEKLKGGRCW